MIVMHMPMFESMRECSHVLCAYPDPYIHSFEALNTLPSLLALTTCDHPRH